MKNYLFLHSPPLHGRSFQLTISYFEKNNNMKCNIHLVILKLGQKKKHEKNYSFWNPDSTQQPLSVLCELRPSSPITSRPTILEKNYRVRGRHQEGLEGSTSEFCTLAPPPPEIHNTYTLIRSVTPIVLLVWTYTASYHHLICRTATCRRRQLFDHLPQLPGGGLKKKRITQIDTFGGLNNRQNGDDRRLAVSCRAHRLCIRKICFLNFDFKLS